MNRSLYWQRGWAFVTHELLMAIALLAIIMALLMPVAARFHWHPLLALVAVGGVYAFVVFCFNFQNIKDDFAARRRVKNESTPKSS